ncbi:8820_t:CDS:2 [Entrophospora sp. SA101]|nr:8820_t:CDS:2 [Entrophospora sp. SA101]
MFSEYSKALLTGIEGSGSIPSFSSSATSLFLNTMEEIIRTNQGLCKQLAEDDEIISEYKTSR